MDVNLRANCLECKFLEDCLTVESTFSPSADELVGTYAITALRKRCVR